MREVTTYYIDGSFWPYYDKGQAEKAEKELLERFKNWNLNTSAAKLDKLNFELKEAMYVPEGTIATTSYDSISIKGMVRVCQKFVDENKHYLNYY